MANIRREFGDDLTLKNGNLGINTTTAQERVDVVGVVKGTDLNVTGVSSLTAYEGFLRADNQIVEETNLEFGNGLKASLSGEIIVGTGVTVTIGAVGLGTTSVGVGTHTIQNNIETTDINLAGGSQIECLKVYNTFTPPAGGTNERPYAPKPVELYYNYDFKTIEFFDGYGWRQVDNTTRSGRGVMSGKAGSGGDRIGYITISTRGNEENFGDLNTAIQYTANGCTSSSTRGLTMGGSTPSPSYLNEIQYLTIASKGNAIDFGDLTDHRHYGAGMSSSTRAICAGGYDGSADVNVIDYVEIPTLGNALDFGDTNVARRNGPGCASPTRGVFGGGLAPAVTADIQSITISSKGNSIRFGDLTTEGQGASCGSNSIRGLFNGMSSPVSLSTIQYVTIASEGNAIDFGDMTVTRRYSATPTSATRAVFAGGGPAPSGSVIDYVEINTPGNAIDFGDMMESMTGTGTISDSHGGLGGF